MSMTREALQAALISDLRARAEAAETRLAAVKAELDEARWYVECQTPPNPARGIETLHRCAERTAETRRKQTMKTFTIDDIRELDPCYDPSRYLPEDWTGTALDILAVEDCPAEDRLWVVLHDEWIPSRTMRLFAVQCARQALALVDDPDPRSIAAVNVAERYANGQATTAELAAARTTAWAAAWVAAWAAAWVAARDAAWEAARDAQVVQLRAMLDETQ